MTFWRALVVWMLVVGLPVEAVAAATGRCAHITVSAAAPKAAAPALHDHHHHHAGMAAEGHQTSMAADPKAQTAHTAAHAGCPCGCGCAANCSWSCAGLPVGLLAALPLPLVGGVVPLARPAASLGVHAPLLDERLRPPAAVAL